MMASHCQPTQAFEPPVADCQAAAGKTSSKKDSEGQKVKKMYEDMQKAYHKKMQPQQVVCTGPPPA